MGKTMLRRTSFGRMLCILTIGAFVNTFLMPAAADVVLRKGTDVKFVFDSPLNSKTAKPGDIVRFHVAENVKAGDRTIIASGTKVSGNVLKVNKRGRYGTNATIQLKMQPIIIVSGQLVALQPKEKGRVVGGRTGEAAAATAGSALVLGPLGLAAGYFIVGKTVNAKAGDKTTVEISKDTTITR